MARHDFRFPDNQFLPPDVKDAFKFELTKSESDSGGKVGVLRCDRKESEESFNDWEHL